MRKCDRNWVYVKARVAHVLCKTKYLTSFVLTHRVNAMVAPVKSVLSAGNPISMDEHARATLRYIRAAMEAAASLAVPGSAGIAVGVVGVAAALLAALPSLQTYWLQIWMASAPVACVLGVGVVARQWSRQGRSMFGVAGRRLALCLLPCLLAGAVLTAADLHEGNLHAIAGTWLLLFGCAVIATSLLTVRLLAWLGALFVAFGVIALLLPTSVHNLLLGAAFGGLHLLFGVFLMGRATHER